MIYNEDTYCIVYHRNVRELGAIPALVLNTIAGMVAHSDGQISNESLAELLGISERHLIPQIKLLMASGYIDKVAGNGRGKRTTYVLTEKGEQNVPLFAPKRVNKLSKKGEQNVPLNNKEINKVITTRIRVAKEEENKEFLKGLDMEQFNRFWNAFRADAEHEHERERCERAWYYKSDDEKESILRAMEDGSAKKWTQSPFVWLQNFKAPLPFVRQGEACKRWLKEHADERKCVILFDGSSAFCLASDLDKMIEAGAKLVNGDWR